MSNTLATKRRRDMARQKWQFLAVLVTVVLGVGMFGGTFNAYLNLGNSLEETYDRLAMADLTVTGAEEGFVDTAASATGVETAIGRQQADVPFEVGEYRFLGRVVGMPPDEQPAVNQLDVDEGEYLDPGDPTGVVLQSHAAQDFDLGPELPGFLREGTDSGGGPDAVLDVPQDHGVEAPRSPGITSR